MLHPLTVCSNRALTLMLTLFDVQDLAGIQLHLHLPVSLVFAEPAVAGEHVLLPVDGRQDLHAVQEPSSAQPLVTVSNQKTADLEAAKTYEDVPKSGNAERRHHSPAQCQRSQW